MQRNREELRVVLYSHDSQGLGHTRRNLAIAHALSTQLPELTGRPVTGLLISGEGGATRFTLPSGWDWVLVPGISKRDNQYVPRLLDVGLDHVLALRGAVIESALGAFRPDLVIVDRHAYGVDGELLRALTGLRRSQPGCRTVLGLREVLDDPQVAAREWARLGSLDTVRNCFDEIWVYGDPRVHDPLATGEVPMMLADKVRYTGFLSTGRPATGPSTVSRTPFVLTMAGGGSDGFDLTLAAARSRVPSGLRHVVITGPQMPAHQRRAVAMAADGDTDVVDAVPDALAEVRQAAAIVTMGGYNSVCEVLSTDTPALVVPRVRPRREQLIRARNLYRHHLAELCLPHEVTPELLTDWWAARTGTLVDRTGVDRAGLSALAPLVTDLLSPAERKVSYVAG